MVAISFIRYTTVVPTGNGGSATEMLSTLPMQLLIKWYCGLYLGRDQVTQKAKQGPPGSYKDSDFRLAA